MNKAKITIIGSGNLATHLSQALSRGENIIKEVYSRNNDHAAQLAELLGAESTDSLEAVNADSEYYIFALKDDVLRTVAERLAKHLGKHRTVKKGCVFIHTAGSVPMSVFEGLTEHYGVLYPMQTFSKTRPVDFAQIPCFVEGNSSDTLKRITALAQTLTDTVVETDSAKRKKLHLAAVLASNLSNHCYRLAEMVVNEEGLDFGLFKPLVMETAAKAMAIGPKAAQTGPMVRYDQTVMAMQESLINDDLTREIYRLMAKSIHRD